jgi:hypothetical protein
MVLQSTELRFRVRHENGPQCIASATIAGGLTAGPVALLGLRRCRHSEWTQDGVNSPAPVRFDCTDADFMRDSLEVLHHPHVDAGLDFGGLITVRVGEAVDRALLGAS